MKSAIEHMRDLAHAVAFSGEDRHKLTDYFSACMMLADDEILSSIDQSNMTDIEILEEYSIRHRAKYNETFCCD